MSEIARKRELLEAVQQLVKARQPSTTMIIAAVAALESVINDMTDTPVKLDLVELN